MAIVRVPGGRWVLLGAAGASMLGGAGHVGRAYREGRGTLGGAHREGRGTLGGNTGRGGARWVGHTGGVGRRGGAIPAAVRCARAAPSAFGAAPPARLCRPSGGRQSSAGSPPCPWTPPQLGAHPHEGLMPQGPAPQRAPPRIPGGRPSRGLWRRGSPPPPPPPPGSRPRPGRHLVIGAPLEDLLGLAA